MRRSLVLLVGLGACDPAASLDETEKRRPRVDAAIVVDAPPVGDPAQAGVISCYRQGFPSATCDLPVHCCFDNYSAHHNGECTTASCAWGTLACDGPEDCSTGLRCCVTATTHPDFGVTSYDGSCKPSCAGPPLDNELCHPETGSCSSGATCVTAYGNANDLPRTLYVCR